MKNKALLSDEDIKLFRESVCGTRQLKQDTRIWLKPVNRKQIRQRRHELDQQNAEFYFSDEYQPLINQQGTVYYLRKDMSQYDINTLRRGDYIPDLFLDLHGLTQLQAKREVAALITACQQELITCACIMHGHGKNILKKHLPFWLAQHPGIKAFHQAPKQFGGNAALLILIELPEEHSDPVNSK